MLVKLFGVPMVAYFACIGRELTVSEGVESERRRRAADAQSAVESNLRAGLDSIAASLEGNRTVGTLDVRFRTVDEFMDAYKRSQPDLPDDRLERIAFLISGVHGKNLDRLKALEHVMEAFKLNQPSLSDDDVERVASRVADRVLRDLPPASPSVAERLRRSARDTAVGVVGGLMATGVVDLMTYLLHAAGVLHAAPHEGTSSGSEERPRRSRDESIQRRLLEKLDGRTLYLFERDEELRERLGKMTERSLIDTLEHSELVDDVTSSYPAESPDYRKTIAMLFVKELWVTVAAEVAGRVAPNESFPPT
jgi:hypothetical protein